MRCVKIYRSNTYNSFPCFAKTMVIHALKNALRKERRNNSREITQDNVLFEQIPSADFEDDLVLMMDESDMLKQLPDNYRRILFMHFQLGFNITQIANELGVSHQAVSRMKNIALKKLKEMMDKK